MSTLNSVTKAIQGPGHKTAIVPVNREALVYYVVGISGRESTTEMST
jgi:hypothetical protein